MDDIKHNLSRREFLLYVEALGELENPEKQGDGNNNGQGGVPRKVNAKRESVRPANNGVE